MEPLNGTPVARVIVEVIENNGGRDRTRTCDLLRVKQALFQLSYDPGRSSNAMKSLSLTSCLVLQSMAPNEDFHIRALN